MATNTRFVRAERDRLDEMRTDLERSQQAISVLKTQIEEL